MYEIELKDQVLCFKEKCYIIMLNMYVIIREEHI